MITVYAQRRGVSGVPDPMGHPNRFKHEPGKGHEEIMVGLPLPPMPARRLKMPLTPSAQPYKPFCARFRSRYARLPVVGCAGFRDPGRQSQAKMR